MIFFLALYLLAPKTAEAKPFFMLTNSNMFYHENTLDVELFFNLPRVKEIEKMLVDGTSININLLTALEEKRTLLSDKEIQTNFVGWQVRYDPLTREFLLYYENEVPRRSRDLANLLSPLFSRFRLSLENLPPLSNKEKYAVTIHIGFQHSNIPPWIEKVLFFRSWDIANDTYTLNFSLP